VAVEEADLAHRVFLGDKGEQGLIKPPAQKFYLTPINQTPEAAGKFRSVLFQPFQKGTAVVEGESESRVLFQYPKERVVAFLPALLEDLIQISHGLVIMYGEKQIDSLHRDPRKNPEYGNLRIILDDAEISLTLLSPRSSGFSYLPSSGLKITVGDREG
jgi:hypothetical protein